VIESKVTEDHEMTIQMQNQLT